MNYDKSYKSITDKNLNDKIDTALDLSYVTSQGLQGYTSIRSSIKRASGRLQEDVNLLIGLVADKKSKSLPSQSSQDT